MEITATEVMAADKQVVIIGGRQYNQAPQPQEPFDLDAFVNERLDVYNTFVDAIKARGGEPSDYVFALGGWVTSAILEQRKK